MMRLNSTTNTTDARRKQPAAHAVRNRRLESIKQQRRRARRGKWVPETKALANVLSRSAAALNGR